MPAGRPPKPTDLKRITGTYRRDRANPREPKPEPAVPLPPPWLPAGLAEEHQRIATKLYKAGHVGELDGPAILTYLLSAEIVQLCDQHWRRGRALAGLDALLINNAASDGVKRNPLLIARREALLDMMRAAEALGMTPAARSRVNALPPEAEDDPLAEFFDDEPRRPRLVADNMRKKR